MTWPRSDDYVSQVNQLALSHVGRRVRVTTGFTSGPDTQDLTVVIGTLKSIDGLSSSHVHLTVGATGVYAKLTDKLELL